MDYIEAKNAQGMNGMRLAVTKNIPNPFCEAAKAIFTLKKIPFVVVAQHAAQPNADLKAWTGYRNAPVAVWNDEPARAGWWEIVMLAERIAPTPPLVPGDRFDRALVFGLCNEICGEDGFGWNSRFMMFPDQAGTAAKPEPGSWDDILQRQYGGSRDAVAEAPGRAAAVLHMLADRLKAQAAKGSRYFVGNSLTAADVYWATFSIGVKQLSDEQSATPGFLRKAWGQMGARLADDLDPVLIEHRERIFAEHLTLPLDF